MVELMVVAVIVAILAAVAIPLLMGNTIRARATEAEAALGTIRAAMRTVLAEHNAYNVGVITGAVAGNVPGFRARAGVAGDLDGTFFSQECFSITALAANTFTVTCTWSLSVDPSGYTPRAGDVNTTTNTTTINEVGTIARTGY
ncbi:MAG: type II secretion system protein, partial [Candidatus Omnitrophota bacterium]